MKLFNLYYEKFNIGHFQGCRNNLVYDENKEYYIKIFEDQKRSYENTKLTLPDDLTIITSWSLWSDGLVSYYSAYFNDLGQEVKVIEEKEWKTVIKFLQTITE